MSMAAAGEAQYEFQFIEWIYLAGGELFNKGGDVGDWLSHEVFAPATEGISDPGDGSYDKVEVAPGSGMHIYVPNAENTGDWDLNLSEKLNENVNLSKVVPVPAPAGDGFFDWNPDTEQVVFNSLKKGGFNLYDFEMTLAKFLQKMPIMAGPIQLTKTGIKPKRVLGQWKSRVTLHNGSEKQLDALWYIYGGRKDVT